MKSTRLTPEPRNPSTSVPNKYGRVGNLAPSAKAKTVLVVPATRPLKAAITRESAAEILRVKLLSRPQHRHAAAINTKPSERPGAASWAGHARARPPAKIAANPITTRRLVAS